MPRPPLTPSASDPTGFESTPLATTPGMAPEHNAGFAGDGGLPQDLFDVMHLSVIKQIDGPMITFRDGR